MSENVNIPSGLKLIQLASDTYVIRHPCLLSPMKTVKIGEDLCIIYSNDDDPRLYTAQLLDLWQKKDVLYLKLWNYKKNKMEMYLVKDDSPFLFLFVSMTFIDCLSDLKSKTPYY
jgi:hypothetical protein